MSVTGTPKKVVLDGVTFNVFADTNIKATPSAYENTAIPTSGPNIRKMVKRAEVREGITLVADGSEQEALKELAERTSDFPMAYETASGDVYRAVGWIEFESHETEENRATISMHPRRDWEAFLKS